MHIRHYELSRKHLLCIALLILLKLQQSFCQYWKGLFRSLGHMHDPGRKWVSGMLMNGLLSTFTEQCCSEPSTPYTWNCTALLCVHSAELKGFWTRSAEWIKAEDVQQSSGPLNLVDENTGSWLKWKVSALLTWRAKMQQTLTCLQLMMFAKCCLMALGGD